MLKHVLHRIFFCENRLLRRFYFWCELAFNSFTCAHLRRILCVHLSIMETSLSGPVYYADSFVVIILIRTCLLRRFFCVKLSSMQIPPCELAYCTESPVLYVDPSTMQIKLCELLYYADSSKSTFLLHRFPCVNYVLNRFRCVNRSILQIPLS
jgi:hypothetical protein